MRPSSANAIKNWFHQQRPLNRRESNQLLDTLTTSFRTHLDREHPITSSVQNDRSHSVESSAASHAPSRPSAHVTTAKHLNMLLSNPLLSDTITGKPKLSSSKAITLRESPAQWFDVQVANGRMNLAAALSVLTISNRTNDSTWKTFNAGTRVLEWLSSNGYLVKEDFIGNRNLASMLVRALCREGNHEPVLKWSRPEMTELILRAGLPHSLALRWQRTVLSAAVEQNSASYGLDYAIARHLQSYHAFASNRELAPMVLTKPVMRIVRRIAQSTKQELENLTHYDEFQASLEIVPTTYSSLKALADVYHPVRPTVEFALEYIKRRLPKTEQLDHLLAHRSWEQLDVSLCLRTAELLLDEERYQETTSVLDILRANYPQSVDLENTENTSPLPTSDSPASSSADLRQLDEPWFTKRFAALRRALNMSSAVS
ncbi:hypothetical protein NA57DRAFT_77230 [Rhizodiscina lignyota]|uniref:Uncharacterized protein n=1 Tax=Rhizodiscina lignyota TaxID=1504668 RepID=A0A9P4I8I5_9PEZI|nr:hypothetical protein NA57DRAFT_77230 [Rhizodiscina lignyota]